MIVVEGRGLHSGARARATLSRAAGPVTLNGTPIAALRVADTERATTVESPRVRTVEHLFSALAGLGVREGVAIEVEGGEVPLADGGAGVWCAALAELGIVGQSGTLRVARAGEVKVGASTYRFEVGDGIHVEVDVEIEGFGGIDAHAAWAGDADDFRARVAPARTFALGRDVEALAARGLASHVDRESVVVLTEHGALWAGRPYADDEPARHKLLDLIGDLYLYGGPPLGRVRARRPGHGATHEALRIARARGIMAGA